MKLIVVIPLFLVLACSSKKQEIKAYEKGESVIVLGMGGIIVEIDQKRYEAPYKVQYMTDYGAKTDWFNGNAIEK